MSFEVAVLIRTFNSDRTLETCLESVHAQTLDSEEIVVVDSGSTDDTLEIAEDHGAEIIHYPDEPFNYSRALNLGMERVETSHVLILSSHVSLPDPQTLELMGCLLREEDDRCAVSIRGMVKTSSDVHAGDVEWERIMKDNFVSEYGGIGISNSCNLIPYKLWERRPFNEDIPRCEDQEWLKYYLERGWSAIRIERPEIVYDNPYYNDEKEIKDIVTLAQYEINPTLTSWRALWRRGRRILSALRRVDVRRAQYELRILLGLLLVRLGGSPVTQSKYF